MFSSKINYEENFSDAQYYPTDEEYENEILWEIEGGEITVSGYED